MALKQDYYKLEINKTIWRVPERYLDLKPLGIGAFGSVWYKNKNNSMHFQISYLWCIDRFKVIVLTTVKRLKY